MNIDRLVVSTTLLDWWLNHKLVVTSTWIAHGLSDYSELVLCEENQGESCPKDGENYGVCGNFIT